MSIVTIGWTETTPADGDNISAGAGVIRSIQTAVRTAMGAEHLFPSSSGAAGAHLDGSARAYAGAGSLISSADTTGRLFAKTDGGPAALRLYYVGSEATWPIGGATVPMVEAGSLYSSRVSGYRIVMSVTSQSLTTYLNRVTFNTTFHGNPLVFCSVNTSGSGIPYYSAAPYNVGISGCSVGIWDIANLGAWAGGGAPFVLCTVALGVIAD